MPTIELQYLMQHQLEYILYIWATTPVVINIPDAVNPMYADISADLLLMSHNIMFGKIVTTT